MESITYNVGGIAYPSFNSTNGIALDLFLSGCRRKEKCKGCHNPELWDFDNGIRMDLEDIDKLISKKKVMDSVAVMGGEPLHNSNLLQLLQMIKSKGKKVWLYTSYELSQIPKNIRDSCDYIKTGIYEEENRTTRESWLASKNQSIYAREGEIFAPYYVNGKILPKVRNGETSIN
jgi:anaerobic ribonucleoside-triphosphate reductase activating protein